MLLLIIGKFTNEMNKLKHLKRKFDRNIIDYIGTAVQ